MKYNAAGTIYRTALAYLTYTPLPATLFTESSMHRHDDSIETLAREDTIQLQKHSWIRRNWIRVLSILAIAAFSAAIYFTGGLSDDLWALGYLGVFLVSILGSVVILIPIPSLPVVFLMGMLLNPFLVGLMVGLGEPIGEIPTYMAGRSGQSSTGTNKKRRFFARPIDWMKRRGALVIFTFALLPNPAFDIAGAAAGAVRYPFWKFLLMLCLGKTVKGWIIAFAGYGTLYLLLKFLID
jgi:membrane protein YqaA with SNARE-associated domain